MRIISKIEIKNDYVVKGINLEGIRKIGNPEKIANQYYQDGIDEIIFSDVVASLYQRNHLYDFIKKFSTNIFVPMTLGGGLTDEESINNALNSGADKVFFNSSILKDPKKLQLFSKIYGSQCIVVSIEAKKIGNEYFCFFNSGRENSKITVQDWIKKSEDLGCGEFIITSIDRDGTKKGFDFFLVENSLKSAQRPVIISGGAGNLEHIRDLISSFKPSGICLSSVLHYDILTIADVKKVLLENKIKYVR